METETNTTTDHEQGANWEDRFRSSRFIPLAEDRDYYDALVDSVPDVPEYPHPRRDY